MKLEIDYPFFYSSFKLYFFNSKFKLIPGNREYSELKKNIQRKINPGVNLWGEI